MNKFTKFGVREPMGESKWQSPFHTVPQEHDNPRGGTFFRRVEGIRGGEIRNAHIGKPLSNRMIDKYTKSGFYDQRHANLKREKRLIWDSELQDFITQ